MATLTILIEGDYDDLRFIKNRCLGACEDVVEEYESNLDGAVEVVDHGIEERD